MTILHIYDNSDLSIRETVWARSDSPPRDKRGISDGANPLGDLLDALLKEGKMWYDRILFETHGKSGRIYFGKVYYDKNWFRSNKSRHYTTLAAVGARIYFNGCNVAEDPDGWDFLDAVADVFLVPGGGEVFGQTSTGFGNPFSGHVVHLWGSTRKVTVSKTGVKSISES